MNISSNLFDLRAIAVTSIPGITAAKAKGLTESGFESAFDLLNFFPRRFVDRRNRVGIWSCELGVDALVLCTIKSVTSRYLRNRKELIEVVAFDDSGEMRVTFFNQGWRKRQLSAGMECAFFGKITEFKRERQMVNPLVDLIGDRTGRIVPIYPQSEKYRFKSGEMPRFIAAALAMAGHIVDPVPNAYLGDLALVGRSDAYRLMHLPEVPQDIISARQRLAFDELLRIQLHLVASKIYKERHAKGVVHYVGNFAQLAKVQSQPSALGRSTGGKVISVSGAFQPQLGLGQASNPRDLVSGFIASLPFALTTAQVKVIGEIALDMASKVPMHRLLQGDVGSGKTLVALIGCLFAIQSGYQTAIMAPTEVLAEQHFIAISRFIEGLEVDKSDGFGLFEDLVRPVTLDILTNKVPTAKRRKLLAQLVGGEIDLVIGTHALISEGVEFSRLGLVIVDEQHRFGVEQRSVLHERSGQKQNFEPDLLVMTATPIPRTAAMTMFGDLDYSVLDELPPGRTPIVTRWAKDQEQVAKVFARVTREVAAKRQAYIVCPLVGESEKIAASSAIATYEKLCVSELKGMRVGLLHGQLPSAQKAQVMELFRRRELDVLVATTVIEVGIDVPNATVMVILDAARFGIAQIHQLRGRVGRGSAQSYCYLVETSELEVSSSARLQACVDSSDGFFLAERDLELRGEGTLLGARQKGTSDLRVASLARDKKLLMRAREVAKSILGGTWDLAEFPLLRNELVAFLAEEDAEFLFRS